MSTIEEQEEKKTIFNPPSLQYYIDQKQEEERKKLEVFIPKPDPKPKTEPKKKINIIPTLRYQYWEENTKNYEKNSFKTENHKRVIKHFNTKEETQNKYIQITIKNIKNIK